MGLLVTNLYNIQINQYQDYKTRSNDNRIKVVPIAPNRGLIFDRNGVLLAENRPVFNLEVIPEKVPNMEETIARLQQLIEISPEKLAAFEKERKQTRRFNSVPLLTQLTDDEVAKFSVNQHKFPGVSVTANLKRYYPYGEVLTHVIGYVSRINDKDLERLDKEGKKPTTKLPEISANWGLNATTKTYCTVPLVIRKSKSTAVAVSFVP